jgi:predicted nucleic acid-binding protein
MSSRNTFILDTNTVLYLIKGDEKALQLIDQKPVGINFLVEIALLGWKFMTDALLQVVTDFIKDVQYFDYSHRVKQRTIFLRQQCNFKLADAFIAVLEFDLTLLSADKTFSQVKDLRFINFSPTINP